MQIRYQRVKNGCFSDQQNKEEAKVIAQAVREHFQKHPDETLGVVAMSAKQRDQIDDEVEMLKKKDDLFADQLDKDAKKSETLFVKNLENVQGDKRDVIFISITYGPKRPGEKVSLLSEPINSEHGGRCLEMLFTRSKKLMHVFSSMDSGDILVGQDAKRGVRALHNFLKDCETGKSAMIDKDEIVKKARSEGAAHDVRKDLKDLKLNRPAYGSRWIWELLQNARDAGAGKTKCLTASIEYQEGELTFLHNGSEFTGNQVYHLIHHGSTKVELKGTIGQFGSGFLTTHLLSSKIDVSGFLNDGRSFEFRLERKTGSIQSIAALLNKAWDDFNPSNKPLTVAMPPGFTTRFAYPISKEASEVVAEGIATLKQCAPFVLVFNLEFSVINIRSATGTTSFKVMNRNPLEKAGMQLVTVSETENGIQQERKYLLATGEKTGEKSTVAFPLESVGSDNVCLLVDNTPRLFLGFPLVGTEKFSFPAIINSFKFNPTEPRNGIYLGQTNEQADIDNQKAVVEAFDLFIDLLGFAAASNLKNAHLLAEIPDIQKQNGLNSDWLRKVLMESLIPAIRRTPVVLSENGAMSPEESKVPFTEGEAGNEGVEALWDLVNDLADLRQKLPSRNEAVGWCKAVKSWSVILRDKVTDFPEVIDGAKLASYVEEKAKVTDEDYGRLSHLQILLRQGESAITWLNRLCGFLKTNGFDNEIRTRSIILNQSGFLDKLSNLHRDQGISEPLKDIAELLGWKIRDELLDTKIPALAEEIGVGGWDNDYVVSELIQRLQARAEQNSDAAFMQSSVRLFTWIVGRENWERLRGFPVFAGGENNRPVTVVYLPRNEQADDRPLAPVKTWPADLQPFADLFLPSRILADAFFEALPKPDVWQQIAEQNVVRQEILISSSVNFRKFYPDQLLLRGEADAHGTSAPVPVTDIWHRADIIERVRDSQARARLFWRFLTEWLSPKDLESLEIKQAECQCGEEHRYYSAAWIEPLRESAWVRLGTDARVGANAQSLASLLRDSDAWNPKALEESSPGGKLLAAIGVSRLELVRELVAGDDDVRSAVDNAFIGMLATSRGDVNRLDQAHQYLKDLETDPNLPKVVAEHLARLQQVRQNQSLGALVEELVKELVEERLNKNRPKGEEFTVRNTGVGSDLAIEEYDLATLEISKPGRRWLVEVKSTRGQEVRMTATQAKTAVQEFREGKRFFLCVVPVSGETSDLKKDVRDKMRFVQNIGKRLVSLCGNLDELVELRKDITAGDSNGVQLKVEDGAAWVRIASSVWQNEGFPLDELPDHLN